MELCENEQLRKGMQRASSAFGKADAADRVVAIAMNLVAKRRTGRAAS
jgi:UDP-N-acetylglucosamine 2-epimerase